MCERDCETCNNPCDNYLNYCCGFEMVKGKNIKYCRNCGNSFIIDRHGSPIYKKLLCADCVNPDERGF